MATLQLIIFGTEGSSTQKSRSDTVIHHYMARLYKQLSQRPQSNYIYIKCEYISIQSYTQFYVLHINAIFFNRIFLSSNVHMYQVCFIYKVIFWIWNNILFNIFTPKNTNIIQYRIQQLPFAAITLLTLVRFRAPYTPHN